MPMTEQKQSPDKEKPENSKTAPDSAPKSAKEVGGRKGPEPTRYGDWENGGKCVDF